MLKQTKDLFDGLGQRVSGWREERRVKAAQKRMAQAHDPHAHSRFWLLNVPALATICAAIVEWYWAVLFCIEATGQLGLDWRTSIASDAATTGAWHFVFDIQSVAVLVGLILATMPIVMLSMIWLPVQFAMRGAGRVRRGSLIAVGILANVLVIVSGTVVMNYNRQDQVREALVVQESAEAQRTMLALSVDDLRGELDTLMNHRSAYVATAASVGAVAYERDYVRQARATNDPRLPLLERALGSARRADELRDQIRQARASVAQAAPAAASAATVEDNVGRELNTFAQYVEVWRPPFVAFTCTLIGIFGAWWTLAMLERLNPKDVLRSGWADDAHRIEDLREEEPIAANPAKMQTVLREENPETGEVKIKITPKPHWRTLKKGKKEQVEIAPDFPADEVGVAHDGGNRAGSVGGAVDQEMQSSEEESKAEEAERETATAVSAVTDKQEVEPAVQEAAAEQSEPNQDEPFSLSETDTYEEELSPEPPVADANPPQDEHDGQGEDQNASEHVITLADNEGVVQIEDQPAEAREPETDPARLIAAE